MRFDFVLLLTAAWSPLLASSEPYPRGILEGITEDELKITYKCKICYDVDYSTDTVKDDICNCRGPWLFVGAYGLFGYDTGRNGVGAFGRKSAICDKTGEKKSNGVIWTFDFSSFKIAPFWAPLSNPLLWQMVNPLNLKVGQQPSYYEYDPNWIFLRKKVWSCPEPTMPTKSPTFKPTKAPRVTSCPTSPPSKLKPTRRPTHKPSPKPTRNHPSPKPSMWPLHGDPIGMGTPAPTLYPSPRPSMWPLHGDPIGMGTPAPTLYPSPKPSQWLLCEESVEDYSYYSR